MSEREQYEYILLFVTDLLALGASFILSAFLIGHVMQWIPTGYLTEEYVYFYLSLGIGFMTSFLFFSQSGSITKRSLKGEFLRSAQDTAIMAATSALVLLLGKVHLAESRRFFICILVVNFLLQPLMHSLLKSYLRHVFPTQHASKLVGILAMRDRAEQLIQELQNDWSKQVCGVAVMENPPALKESDTIAGVPVKAHLHDFVEWVRRDALDEVYLDVPTLGDVSLAGYIMELESMGLDIHFSVPLLEKLYGDCEQFRWPMQTEASIEKRGETFLIGVSTTPHNVRDMFIKRIIDILGAVVGILISIPIIAIVSIPLKLDSPGPLFFKQRRVGRNGRYFYMYKLRSMCVDADKQKSQLMSENEMDGLMFKVKKDPRITKVGQFIRKTSIDELPQFFNVLKGDMSLVGTRPPIVEEYLRYESHHKRRLSMKPGMTGMWQISGRSDVQRFEDVVRLDTQYIDNWSIKLDLQILLATISVVFKGKGAR